jgi:hypothetical protein
VDRPRLNPTAQCADKPATPVVHIPLGEIPVDDRDRQLTGSDGGQRGTRLPGRGPRPGAEPGADGHQPFHARLPVHAGLGGDRAVLAPPAGTLPDPLAKVTQRQVQPGQVTASPPPLRRAFAGGGPAGDIAGQAVPQPVVAHRIADRVRDSPSGAGQVTKHRVLIPQILRAGPLVVAPQHGTPPAGHLDQPAAVARRDILQHHDLACPHARYVKHAGDGTGQHRGHPSRASPAPEASPPVSP